MGVVVEGEMSRKGASSLLNALLPEVTSVIADARILTPEVVDDLAFTIGSVRMFRH